MQSPGNKERKINMKKMPRFLALVTVLVLMLSMSVTAFAAPTYAPSCTAHRYHLFAYKVYPGTHVICYAFDGTTFLDGAQYTIGYFNTHFGTGDTDDALGKWYYATDDTFTDGAKCPQCRAFVPQPKTGVMDTLPLWFGVMAVSACAYVLTSKKRVF